MSAPDPRVQALLAVRLVAEYGFYVFPVDHPTATKYCTGIKTKEHNPDRCTERGKHPCCKWSEWSTNDGGLLVRDHYFGGRNAKNIGIDCRKSGLLVLDEDALEELARFCTDHDVELPATFTVRTANGFHYYFRQLDGEQLGNREGLFRGYKINVRGAGGYVVGPGSLHFTGLVYAVQGVSEITALPLWVVEALKAREVAPNPDSADGAGVDAWWRVTYPIRHPKRHEAMVAAAGWCRRMGLKRDEAIPTMRDVFARLEGDKYTWDQCLGRLDDIYARYEAGYRIDANELHDASGDKSEEHCEPADGSIDWAAFWSRDRTAAAWLYDDVLALHRGHALYASHKDGKSLLMLAISAALATSDKKVVVAYFDYEMGEDDLYERLADMDYGPETDLSRLRYWLLPTLPPLDTREGAQAIVRIIEGLQRGWPDHYVLVVLDTTARAVAGDENAADTFRAFYSNTGIELKRRGVTWVRLDHAGKDVARGQRGSSSKGDDVDVVWHLVRTESGLQLRRKVSRMGWVPEKVTFTMLEYPLQFKVVAGDWPADTAATARLLERLGVPVDAPVRQAAKALKDAGEGRRSIVVQAAVRWRREQVSTVCPDPPDTPSDEAVSHRSGRTRENRATTGRTRPRTHRDTLFAVDRDACVPPYGDARRPAPSSAPADDAVESRAEEPGGHPQERADQPSPSGTGEWQVPDRGLGAVVFSPPPRPCEVCGSGCVVDVDGRRVHPPCARTGTGSAA